MKRNLTMASLLTLGIVSLVLFQNCGGEYASLKSQDASSTNETTSEDTATPTTPTDPSIIVNANGLNTRDFGLDNLQPFDQSLTFDLAQGDRLFFETPFRASTVTTLVEIYFDATTRVNMIKVEGDDCNADVPINFDDLSAFFDTFSQMAVGLRIDVNNAPFNPDCGYPRLGIDSADPNNIDLEAYVTADETCVPFGKYHAQTQVAEINAFFEAQVSLACQ